MANQKISALTALLGNAVDTAADVLPIVDTSAGQTKKILVDELRIALLSNTAIVNTLVGNVSLNNTGSYFTGPTCAQGTSGVWFATGVVTYANSDSTLGTLNAKLWDGTTVISSSSMKGNGNTVEVYSIHLAGFISGPVANIRISVNDSTSTSGVLAFNASGNSKDCSLTVIRIG